jgi:hypothetical protein
MYNAVFPVFLHRAKEGRFLYFCMQKSAEYKTIDFFLTFEFVLAEMNLLIDASVINGLLEFAEDMKVRSQANQPE